MFVYDFLLVVYLFIYLTLPCLSAASDSAFVTFNFSLLVKIKNEVKTRKTSGQYLLGFNSTKNGPGKYTENNV